MPRHNSQQLATRVRLKARSGQGRSGLLITTQISLEAALGPGLDLTLGGGMMAQLLIAKGYRCPGRLALPSSERMSSTADASKGAGSHSSSALGRSLPPAGATHTSCPPCSAGVLHFTGVCDWPQMIYCALMSTV